MNYTQLTDKKKVEIDILLQQGLSLPYLEFITLRYLGIKLEYIKREVLII